MNATEITSEISTLRGSLSALEAASGRELRKFAAQWLETAQVNTLRPAIAIGPDGTYTEVAVRQEAPAESSNQRSTPIPLAGTQIPHSTVPATQRPGPVEPVAGRTEIVALRRVWVRVIVDGTREVERELRADERVALPSGRTIVIRTGDAGAIRLTMNGQDRGTLGPEGEVVTRTFTAPAPANR